ncbi:MAG TPA: hypothetical protein VF550_12505 [Polyangia bacterium]
MKLNLKALKKLDDTPPWEWPEDTGLALLDLLRDPGTSEEERLLGVELAGDSVVVDDALVAVLLIVLRNGGESELVRSRAAISLGPVLELCDTDGFDDPDDATVTEATFHEIQKTMRTLYQDTSLPKEVRRRVLEASVRAPLDWHQEAIRTAYASDDEEWRLTAVFCMGHVRGFDEQILASLDSRNLDIQVEAVCAAGNWEVGAAWPHVLGLVTARGTDRRLLLAAIAAVGTIRPGEASAVLGHLADSQDDEIAEAVLEATAMANARWNDEADVDGEDDEDLGPLN